MACIATSNIEYFKVYDCELNDKTYTVETLRRFKSANKNEEFFFIGGSDNLKHFAKWKEPSEIVKMTNFIVAERFGSSFDEAKDAILSCGAKKDQALKLDFPRIDISSSMIRQRLYGNLECTYLLPEGVLRYIKANRLYKEAQTGN
jgi:nicotinate-nucleotide adenylyltransferase